MSCCNEIEVEGILDEVVVDGQVVKERLVVDRPGRRVQRGVQELLRLLGAEDLTVLSEELSNK